MKVSSVRGSETFDVRHMAKLSRLCLTDDEAALFTKQLAVVAEYFRMLAEVDVTGVEPTAHAIQVTNVFREDQPASGLERHTALENAPLHDSEQILVPVIVQ